ncbi:Hypothetical protein PHPALM_11052 [Phytophthora palmivora]|uniref:Uncharacterized protein n=1 Tax=Phytophthora palmivora TaxID=4796 RepID=A0A2P4Y3A1_9STRA|nr:Hypothetical protein PHPALM_11052 [Phytophthora palmivora]
MWDDDILLDHAKPVAYSRMEALLYREPSLDVSGYRSYQEYYRSKYDEYIGKTLSDPQLQTKARNPKVPKYNTVAQWTLDWMGSRTPENIQQPFSICGLVAKVVFGVKALHPPL